jgi:hypothetical protein
LLRPSYQRLLLVELDVNVVVFKHDVIVRAEALLDARDGLVEIARAEIAAAEVDRQAAVVQRAGLVDAVDARRHDAIHAHLGADTLCGDNRN